VEKKSRNNKGARALEARAQKKAERATRAKGGGFLS
jgi:hypothetical protein